MLNKIETAMLLATLDVLQLDNNPDKAAAVSAMVAKHSAATDLARVNQLADVMAALVDEGVLTGLVMEHILHRVRSKTENDSFFATWHDNHIHKS